MGATQPPHHDRPGRRPATAASHRTPLSYDLTWPALPRGPLTVDDLADLPDDGHRYELIDGTLLVTPALGTAHQLAVGRLHLALGNGLADRLVAMLAPYDYVIAPGTVLEPDLLVVRAEQLAGERLTTTPLLVVEVLSPSTRRTDLGSKRLAYQEAGVPAYWILDPVTTALTVHRLDGSGAYQTTIISPPAVWVDPELGVTIDPAQLCGPAHLCGRHSSGARHTSAARHTEQGADTRR